ncbi:MAG: hypothetical protein QOE99_3102 [Actinomycetota bacterium]|nr:hypothetical protein [Actinomycetota bacterium]
MTPPVELALSRVQDLDELQVAEHVAVYDEVHRLLQDALAALDDD